MADTVSFRPVTVNGRELIFNAPNFVQVTLLHRLVKVASAASDAMQLLDKQGVPRTDDRWVNASQSGLEATAKILDMFASLTAPDVNEWMVDQMLTGKIDDQELLRILTEVIPQDEEAPVEKTPVKKPHARRTA